MDFETLLLQLQEATKIIHMDTSHSAVRDKIQTQLAKDHRQNNMGGSYYDYPYVRDVFGNETAGTVVHVKGDAHTMSKYQKDGEGYKLSDHKSVKPAYVTVAASQSEAAALYIDGQEATLEAKEALIEDTHEEILNLREAAFDANGNGTVRIVAPGHGATGYYSKEVLKEAADKKVFGVGTQMFLDHDTPEEEAGRPAGSVKRLAGKTTSDAVYEESGAEGPGLYAKANVYPDFKDFLNARAKDIGVSMRVLGRGVAGQIQGKVNKIVKSLDVAKSIDFVTRAGAGGKLVPLLESFRAEQRQPAAQRSNMEINDAELLKLKESAALVPQLQLKVDRYDERFARLDARDLATAELKESGLPTPAQNRLIKMLAGDNSTLPLVNGILDTAKFKESIKLAVADEANYLKESGAVRPIVHDFGGPQLVPNETEKTFLEAQKGLGKEFNSLVDSLSGIEKPKEAAKA